MSSVDSAIVFLPRFTSLAGATTFTTQPMDVSAYGGVQFQFWRGPFRVKTASPPASFTVYLEESLDTETWVLGPSTPGAHVIEQNEIKFFSYSFRLRWFRVRIEVAGDDPIVTCWAEGLLRGGGDGVWPSPQGRPFGEITELRGVSGGWDVQAYLDWQAYRQLLAQWGRAPQQGPMPTMPSSPDPGDPTWIAR